MNNAIEVRTDQEVLASLTELQLVKLVSELEKTVEYWNELVRERVDQRRTMEKAYEISVDALEERRRSNENRN